MKKVWICALILVLSMTMGSAVYAKDGKSGGSRGEDGHSDGGGNLSNAKDSKDGQKEADDQELNDDKGSVTDSVYGQGNHGKHKGQDKEQHKADQQLKKDIKDMLKLVEEHPSTENVEALKALIDQLKTSVDNGTSDEEDVEMLAAQEMQDGKHDEAKAYTEKALQNNPQSDRLYKVLSGIYKEKGDTKNLKVYVNGKQPAMDVKPYLKEGRTMIPLRAISEALDAKVDWDNETRTVIITKDDIVIKLPLGSSTITVNGEQVAIDAPAELSEERTMVPVRFVSEFLKKKVDFDPETNLVVVK